MSGSFPTLGWRSMTFHQSISSYQLPAHPKQKPNQIELTVSPSLKVVVAHEAECPIGKPQIIL
jgi:hypothetical protein